MPHDDAALDPRTRRTRLALQAALQQLLALQAFETISVGDIARAASVNRATFYDHYQDKYALLEAMVAARFAALLGERNVRYDGSCVSALRGIVLGICDFLSSNPQTTSCDPSPLTPQLELAIIGVVRRMLLCGINAHPSEHSIAPEMIAATASWAMYGAAKEWFSDAERVPSESIADTILAFIEPMMHDAVPASAASSNIRG